MTLLRLHRKQHFELTVNKQLVNNLIIIISKYSNDHPPPSSRLPAELPAGHHRVVIGERLAVHRGGDPGHQAVAALLFLPVAGAPAPGPTAGLAGGAGSQLGNQLGSQLGNHDGSSLTAFAFRLSRKETKRNVCNASGSLVKLLAVVKRKRETSRHMPPYNSFILILIQY